jgi:hypothetical protein
MMKHTIEQKRTYLETLGYFCGARDTRLNTKFPGKFVVTDNDWKEYHLPTQDGSNGPWCIVGDSLDDLICQAFNIWYDPIFEEENHQRALKVAGIS